MPVMDIKNCSQTRQICKDQTPFRAASLSNAELVPHQIDTTGGSIALVYDYTARVSGTATKSNREGIQFIINRAPN
jgi:hypothetical protein